MSKVAIIGYGWVGQAVYDLFSEVTFPMIYSHNLILHEGEWIKTNSDSPLWKQTEQTYKDLVNQCDVAFICVPTPNATVEGVTSNHGTNYEYDPKIPGEGKLDTSAVEECIAWCECPLIVIRSTVNPGDCERWEKKYKKAIVFQPEYLGETPQHPLLDTKQTPFIIIGRNPIVPEIGGGLIDLYTTVYNANVTIRQVSLREAEIIKLTENRAIAFKVAQCQELYDVCAMTGDDYYTIRDAVYGDDPRFNLWWTFVYPDKRGFKSKCIPKDIYAWCAWAESVGYEPKITRGILEKNKEWTQ